VSDEGTERPSPWAAERFGSIAGETWRRIPRALAATVAHATQAHRASRLKTKHAFGSTRWALQYDELRNHLVELPDVHVVRPARAFYRLVIAHGNLLLPWRYAEDAVTRLDDPRALRSMRSLTREMLLRFGDGAPGSDRPPHWEQHALFQVDAGASGADPVDPGTGDGIDPLDALQPPPRPVLIAYACNPAHGLIDVQWGDAFLDEDGALHWRHRERLPVPNRARPG
jgi:hypothetical protein